MPGAGAAGHGRALGPPLQCPSTPCSAGPVQKRTAWDLEQLWVLVPVLAAQPLPWWAQSSVNGPPPRRAPAPSPW